MYIFDLEGTLTDNKHRIHLVPDWDKFHAEFPKDKPRKEIASLFRACSKIDEPIVILTGMMEKHSKMANEWLSKYHLTPDFLYMRPNDDLRPSPEFKLDFVRKIIIEVDRHVSCMFDDRSDIVNTMLKNNIPAVRV